MRPASSRSDRGELDDHLDDRAGAEAEQERGEAGVERRGADPRAEHRGRARDQPEQREPARASGWLVRDRARRWPAPRWCCGARSRRRGRRRARARRPRRRSRSPRPRRGCAGRCRRATSSASVPRRAARRRRGAAAPAQPRRHARQHQEGDRPRRCSTSAAPPNACEPSPASSRPSSVASIAEERRAGRPSAPSRRAASAGGMRRIHGSHSMPERDRDHADVDAEQRHQPEEGRGPSSGVSTATGISCAIVPPGRGEQRDLVGLALDPRLLDAHASRCRGGRSASSAPVNCAKASLTMTWAIDTASGPSLRTVSSITPGLQHRALDDELLDRRAAAVAEAGAAERGERPDRRGDQQQRHEPEQPGGEPPGPAPACRRRAPPSALTSKKPCQPSSVNSDWCAWNMNLPAVREAPLEDPALALAQHHRVGEARAARARARSGSSRRSWRAGGTS